MIGWQVSGLEFDSDCETMSSAVSVQDLYPGYFGLTFAQWEKMESHHPSLLTAVA